MPKKILSLRATFSLHSGMEANPEGECDASNLERQPRSTAILLSPHTPAQGTAFPGTASVAIQSPHLSARSYFFSGCFCLISIGKNDRISVQGTKDIGTRTVGREGEEEGWTVATPEVGVCCGASRGPANRCCPPWIPVLVDTRGLRQGLCSSSQNNRNCLGGRGRC